MSSLERLAALDVCTVSDALDALGVEGAVLGLQPVWEGAQVAGRAVTVTLAEGPPPAGSPPVHLGARAIAASGPGNVIVVANDGRTGMGAWGGLLSFAASLGGVAGVVVDGACRDVDEARTLRFPAFARSGVQRTARGRVHERATGEPVTIAGVAVRPGDIVLADGSGVVVVPDERADEVATKAEEIASREEGMKAALREGVPVTEVLGNTYESMLKRS